LISYKKQKNNINMKNGFLVMLAVIISSTGFSQENGSFNNIQINGKFVLKKDAFVNGVTIGRGANNRDEQTALGASALSSNTTGIRNTAIGDKGLRLNTTGSENTALGANALSANTTGSENVAIGYGSLQNCTTGIRNTAVGFEALRNNFRNNQQVAFGYQALYNDTSGTGNVGIGYKAGYSNLKGQFNTAVGYEALRDNTTSWSTAVGYQALVKNTTGDDNTAVGHGAMRETTTGNLNAAFGYLAGSENTTGSENTWLGWGAGYASNVTGVTSSFNTAVGNMALSRNKTGGSNTSVGYHSLFYNRQGINNVALGYRAGRDDSSGNNNVFIGYQAGLGLTTGSGNIAIGPNITLAAGATNTITLASGAGTRLADNGTTWTMSGALSVGTVTSTGDVSASGGVKINGTAEIKSTAQGVISLYNIANTDFSRLTFGGLTSAAPAISRSGPTLNFTLADGTGGANVGIGTPSPTASLHIKAGTATASTAPLKFTAGTNLATVENGTVEYDGTNYFVSASNTRYTVAKLLTTTATINFPVLDVGEVNIQSITIADAEVGDIVTVEQDPNHTYILYSGYVTSAGTVAVRAYNAGGSSDPESYDFKVAVTKF
jgi:trimeric autotransporter adhesin